MSPVIDFSDVKGLEPLPVGEYLAKVVHAEEGISTRSQQPKIEYRAEVIAPEEFAGRQFFDGISFHPAALYKAKQKLIGLGFDPAFMGEVSAESLLDREAAFVLEIEEGQPMPEDEAGEPGEKYPDRNRVRRIRPADKYGKGNAPSAAAAGLEALELPEPTPQTTSRRGRNNPTPA